MRFKINLNRSGSGKFLPINYQYELSSLIYKIIDRADTDFAQYLHNNGYTVAGKAFRLFNFSRLSFDKYKVYGDEKRIEHQGQFASFYISFLVDRAAEEFIKGLFMNQQLQLGDKITQIHYEVSGIESCERPVFQEKMRYRCLSPILIKQKRADGGENYLQPKDKDYAEILAYNLCSKAQAFALNADELNLGHQTPQIDFQLNGKVYKNGVLIKQHTSAATHMIAYMYEFELTAPPELHEIGYYAGIGHLNSQGFGCVEVK
ncbi:CRISPR-associated endoribonuclease Cas6 [Marivirga sp.]|uniref:CRISPR-associated endoribonuclease Cas6 n=1 Tax=Marivirga sp. TaxID=2018662 RepID=UPI002D7E2EC0|nr:CRISPR-associated endoribonuclease Cas6 [Marivirga sp.]HET8861460.1 CRISPR-associated endoribonuclease Cas6 [Marivirga sp.]